MSDQPFNNEYRADAQQPLGGCLVALITPMTVDGAVDEEALRKLVHWHMDKGLSLIHISEPTDQRGARMPSSA